MELLITDPKLRRMAGNAFNGFTVVDVLGSAMVFCDVTAAIQAQRMFLSSRPSIVNAMIEDAVSSIVLEPAAAAAPVLKPDAVDPLAAPANSEPLAASASCELLLDLDLLMFDDADDESAHVT